MRIAIVIVLLALMLVIIAVVNILHSGIKTILRQRGYAVSLWYGHFRDISLFRDAIANENDQFTKQRYRKVLYAYFASVVLFLLGALLLTQVWN